MSERTRRLFQDFLIEQDAYDDFCYQLYIQRGLSFSAYMRLAEHTPKKIIEMAFNWGGKNLDNLNQLNYWQILNNKWIKYYETL